MKNIDVNSLVSFLNDKTGYVNKVGTELNTFCPFCEEHKYHKQRKHAHLYINLNTLQVNCFKCEEGKGLLFKIIKKLEGNPSDYISGFSFSEIERSKNKKLEQSVYKNDFYIKEQYNDKFEYKKEYIRQRVQTDIDFSKVPNIVFSIKDFIADNDIELPIPNHMIDKIETDYVGFLGNRGTILVFRDVTGKNERYVNIKIKNNVYFKDFYGISLKPMTEHINTIVLCEGIFDLLVSIKSAGLKHLVNSSILWAACLNKSFVNSVISTLDFCKISKANFVFLSDSNVQEKDYYWVYNKPFIGNVDVYWNRHKDDFGELPIDPIKIKMKIGDTRYGRNTPHSTNNQ